MISTVNSKTFIPFFTVKKEELKRTQPSAVEKNPELKKVFQLYHRTIFKLCWQITRSRETSENITVQVFVDFYQDSQKFGEALSTGDYLRQLAVGKLLNYQQQRIG